jgi:hypothetical protein
LNYLRQIIAILIAELPLVMQKFYSFEKTRITLEYGPILV